MPSSQDIDPQLLLLRRQYLQLFEPDFMAWPPPQLLRDPDVQNWLYRHMFDAGRNARLPPERYQMRVLKPLVARIERAVQDPDQDEISDDLMARLGAIMAQGFPDQFQAVQEKAYVTFTCLSEGGEADGGGEGGGGAEPTVTLLERRHLISGSKTTGFRTWEAALHLGSYLLTRTGSGLVRGKDVLELGAGTGFLSILCAKYLRARHVTTTDGDGGVVETLQENLELNGLADQGLVRTNTLWWGEDLRGTWVEEDCNVCPYDVVIGADITYDKEAIVALVATIKHLFEMRPALQVIIAGVMRNAETFQAFRDECAKCNFKVEEVEHQAKPMREQKALFYAAAVPIKILSITNS
ncbi:putative methyltransferase-domain-containing protein [Xylariomycetidae sp. FL2044]|nr:putative methyltransferase-domain-containing protein [Xylariomycetidae sp. FL2044]